MQILSAYKRGKGTSRKPDFIGTQKSQDVNIKDKLQKKKIIKQKLLQVQFSMEKKNNKQTNKKMVGYVILTVKCYPKNT